MTFEEWRSEFHPYPTDNDDFARLAWNAATLIERERCAKLAEAIPGGCAANAGEGSACDMPETIATAIRGSDAQPS